MSSVNIAREESLKKAREVLKEKRLKEKMETEKESKKRKREEEEEKHENIDTSSIVALPVPVLPLPERKTDESRKEEKEEFSDMDGDEESIPPMEGSVTPFPQGNDESYFNTLKSKVQDYSRDLPNNLKSGAKSCISSLCWSAAFAGILVVRYMVQSRIQDAVGRLASSYQKSDDDINSHQNSDKPSLPIETQNQPIQTPKSINFNEFMR